MGMNSMPETWLLARKAMDRQTRDFDRLGITGRSFA